MSSNLKNVIEDSCCGCGACYQICPKKSIQMEENERGFLVPIVDETTCVKCGACLKVCPEKERPLFNTVKKAYAAISQSKGLLTVSTSGGVFGEMARLVISEGGCVYGCAWDENLHARHKKVECLDDLQQIQKSKYVQSDTNTTFIDVRNDLKQGRKVLYSGTACQIAGLRKFLNGREDRLITVEVACHGVPSPGLFQKYINWKSRIYRSKIVGIQFRNKEKHKKGEHYMFRVDFDDGKQQYCLSNEDPYYGAFLEGRSLRQTCYNCKYKQRDRVADILLGDYWGVEKVHPDFPAQNGASAIVITSEKGLHLFEQIEDGLIFEKSEFDRITKHNKSIISCAKCPVDKRLKFIDMDADRLFSELKPKFSIKKRIKNMVPEKVKYLLKRL